MSVFDLIPTSDNLMSQYTLIAFVIYSGILLLVGKVAVSRLDTQETDIEKMTEAMNALQIDVAVMSESLKNIETDGRDTRTAIAEINRTLLDVLKGK